MLARFATFALLAVALGVANLGHASLAADAAPPLTWKAGVAKVVITPEKPMWMSGYSSRDHAAEGKLHDLWAKALVLQDAAGTRVALVTLDLVGIDRQTSLTMREAIEKQYGLARANVALCCSHTHTGPVVGQNLRAMYFLDEAQSKLVAEYTTALENKVVALVGQAIAQLEPAAVSWGTGRATFAVNRRNNPEPEVPAIAAAGRLLGPFDHDVPVLAVRDGAGKLRTILCGYACHSTCLSFFQWSGDYPGFAQLDLEKAHPEAIAMFWAGCGGDQNPLPRRTVELAANYGRQLADAVDRELAANMTPITGNLDTSYAEIDLPLEKLPTRDELEKQYRGQDKYVAARAKLLLAQIDAGEPLRPTYPYPVQVWRLGNGPTWFLLGGEVVVDYALRIKSELAGSRTWVAAYTNDVMAYIPSRRIRSKGAYEGASAMIYYGLPTSWKPEVEELIIKEIRRQAAAVAPAKQ